VEPGLWTGWFDNVGLVLVAMPRLEVERVDLNTLIISI
jgi:hypothetical protein